MTNYQLESVAERCARKERDIKTLFLDLTINDGMPFMEAYEAVGYRFYEQAVPIRRLPKILQRVAPQ